MRGVDTLPPFPGILMAIVLITIMGPGLLSVGVAMSVFNIPSSAPLARAGVLLDRERKYVTAARAIGASGKRILWRHVAVNTFGALAVALPLSVVTSVLTMAALNFLSDVLSERLDPVRGHGSDRGGPSRRRPVQPRDYSDYSGPRPSDETGAMPRRPSTTSNATF